MSAPGAGAAGALAGVRVIELASERAAFAGKLLADLGADVIVVEPPEGHATRRYGPFLDDQPGPDRSLWWWYYNTSKRSVVLDLETPAGAGAFRSLAASADIVLEGADPGSLAALGIDHVDVRAERPELIWASVTPFGRTGTRKDEPATDLTLLAGGGPMWSCGYDDHTLPPVRPGENQGLHIAGAFAAMSALTALLYRDAGGAGQHIDVSMHAAANVTTEMGSVEWLVEQATVQRQTGRHAMVEPTMQVQVQAGDGRYVTTGFPPSEARDYQSLLDWMDELGVREQFDERALLELGISLGGIDPRTIANDPVAAEIYGAGRAALTFIASKVGAYEFFCGAQDRDFQCGIVYSPDEALGDKHFRERGFDVPVRHDEFDRTISYPGAPFKLSASPWRIRSRAPLVGEHTAQVLAELADSGSHTVSAE